MVVVAFFGRRSSLVFDLSPSKKVGLCLSLSLSRFSLARLCGAIERAERLNSIVDCGYKTLNLKDKKKFWVECQRTCNAVSRPVSFTIALHSVSEAIGRLGNLF